MRNKKGSGRRPTNRKIPSGLSRSHERFVVRRQGNGTSEAKGRERGEKVGWGPSSPVRNPDPDIAQQSSERASERTSQSQPPNACAFKNTACPEEEEEEEEDDALIQGCVGLTHACGWTEENEEDEDEEEENEACWAGGQDG